MNGLRSILLLLVVPALACAGDWPQWLGPKRDGSSSETILPWKESPPVAWRVPMGPGFSVPVIANGKVFVHARVAGKDEEEVTAFDAKTGKKLWHDAYERAPYASALNTGPQATPAVSGNHLVTYGITGVLSCYAADSGKRLWQVDAYKKMQAKLPRFGVCCSPLIVGNRAIISVGGPGSAIVAFDIEKGDIAWQGFDEPANTSSPVLFTRKGALPDVVFMSTLRIVGLNPLDGSLNWDFPLVFHPSGTAPSPLVRDDLLMTSTIDNGTTAVRIGVKDEKANAERVWQNKDLSGYFSTGVTASGERLYLVTNVLKPIPNASLKCVDLKTGKEIWAKGGLGYFHIGVVRTGDDRLLILDDAGNLRLAEGDAKGYHELVKSKVCGGTFVVPALANGRLYVRDDKEVICLKLAD